MDLHVHQEDDELGSMPSRQLTTSSEETPCEPPAPKKLKTHASVVQSNTADGATPESCLPAACFQEDSGPLREKTQRESQRSCNPSSNVHADGGTSLLSSSTTHGHVNSPPSGHDASRAAIGTTSPGLLETLRSQMDEGFRRRREQFLEEIFNKHKSPDSAGLSKASLVQALRDLGLCMTASEVAELFHTQDLNGDGLINWTAFLMILANKVGKIEQWASTLPLAALLADCMPSNDDVDPVRALSKLDSAEIQAIATCFSEGLLQVLRYVDDNATICDTMCANMP
jgi:hypothetical protein